MYCIIREEMIMEIGKTYFVLLVIAGLVTAATVSETKAGPHITNAHNYGPAMGSWGCWARESGSTKGGRSFGSASRSVAENHALQACSGRCRIISCSSQVRSPDEAVALWPLNQDTFLH